MKLQSKYLERFSKLAPEEVQTLFIFYGSKIIIEKIDDNDLIKSAGGIILAVDEKSYKSATVINRCALGIVLLAGGGTVDADGIHSPVEFKPGSVVMYTPSGLWSFSTFPGVGYTQERLGALTEGDVFMSWASLEDFEKFAGVLA